MRVVFCVCVCVPVYLHASMFEEACADVCVALFVNGFEFSVLAYVRERECVV